MMNVGCFIDSFIHEIKNPSDKPSAIHSKQTNSTTGIHMLINETTSNETRTALEVHFSVVVKTMESENCNVELWIVVVSICFLYDKFKRFVFQAIVFIVMKMIAFGYFILCQLQWG